MALREIHVQVPVTVANSGHGQSTLACSETPSIQWGWLWTVNCPAKVSPLCWDPWDESRSWRLRCWAPDAMALGGRDIGVLLGNTSSLTSPWKGLSLTTSCQAWESPTSLLCPPPHDALNSSPTHPMISSGLRKNFHSPLKPMYPHPVAFSRCFYQITGKLTLHYGSERVVFCHGCCLSLLHSLHGDSPVQWLRSQGLATAVQRCHLKDACCYSPRWQLLPPPLLRNQAGSQTSMRRPGMLKLLTEPGAAKISLTPPAVLLVTRQPKFLRGIFVPVQMPLTCD